VLTTTVFENAKRHIKLILRNLIKRSVWKSRFSPPETTQATGSSLLVQLQIKRCVILVVH